MTEAGQAVLTAGIFIVCSVALAVACIAGGILMIRTGRKRQQEAADMPEWPSTQGTVTEAEVRRVVEEGESYHRNYIKYEYVVDGETYKRKTDQLVPGATAVTMGGSASGGLMTTGSPVVVYYSPDDPSKGSLKHPKYSGAPTVMVWLGFGLAGFGLLSACSALVMGLAVGVFGWLSTP